MKLMKQERHVFEYAVIRLVPRVEREEFLNIGVVLYCAKHKFLEMRYHVEIEKWYMMDKQVEVDEVIAHLKSFKEICMGGQAGGTIGRLDRPDRFRWLTATRSTILQTSKVHLGLCEDPQATLSQLFEQLVL